MIKQGGPEVEALILDSQKWMAEQTARLHQALEGTQLWLVGYSELKEGHFFMPYRDTLKSSYNASPKSWNNVYVFQHFSMNRFSIDLKEYSQQDPTANLMDQISKLGQQHKTEIFS